MASLLTDKDADEERMKSASLLTGKDADAEKRMKSAFGLYLSEMASLLTKGNADAEVKAFAEERNADFKKAFGLSEKNGCIKTEQLGIVMRSLGVSTSETELQHMMSKADEGEINFDKFLNLMVQKMKVVSHSSVISYTYLTLNTSSLNRTSLGKVVRTNENIYVDYGSVNGTANNFLHSFSHRAYLPIRFFDDASSSILHLPYSSSIVDHVATLKLKNIFPIMTYQFIDEFNSYDYVPETYRKLVRDLVDFVLHLHTLGKSLVHLDLDNLCVRDGELNLWGLRFSEMDHVSEKNDFLLVYSVINALFALGGRTSNQKLPYDFDVLLSEIGFTRRATVLKNHFALLTAKEKVQFVKNMGDVSAGFHKNHMNSYEKAVKNMGSHNNNWKRRIKTRAVYECLNFQRNYVDKGTTIVVNKSLLKLCRNSATHLWESLLEYLRNTGSSSVRTITYEDIECILMKDLGRVLMDFHESLALENLRHHFYSF